VSSDAAVNCCPVRIIVHYSWTSYDCSMRHAADLHGIMLEQLRTLPFVRSASFRPEPKSGGRRAGATLVVTTPSGARRLLVEVLGSNLTYAVAARLVGQFKAQKLSNWFVYAPYIPGPMGRYLAGEGVNFLDGAGNCSLTIDKRYLARIEGRRPARIPERVGMRAASYQVVFALLAGKDQVNRTVRELAELAGVGKSTVAQTLQRLEVEGFIGHERDRKRLLNGKLLLDRWLGGYAEVLRPRWLQGRYQVGDLQAFERQVPAKLGTRTPWGWSGGVAAMRLAGHYRGPEAVLCLGPTPGNALPRDLGMLADREGPVSLLQAEGTLAFKGATPETLHPLLVYGELLAKPADRAAEAAEEVRAHWLPWLGS